MPQPILITYNRLGMTEHEAETIINNAYHTADTKRYHAVDAVAALAGGKEMQEGVIYHFNGMGSSAFIPPSERMEESAENSEERGDVSEMEITEKALIARFIGEGSSHSNVTSVCVCSPSICTARRSDGSDDVGKDKAPGLTPTGTEWNLREIKMNGARAGQYSGRGIKIAILDTGIASHEHLNVMGGVSFCIGIDDFRRDPFGHGTNCAGVAAGQKGGVAKEAELFSIKLTETAPVTPIPILAGLGWALKNQINVVSISLAGPADLEFIPACANAVQALMEINCLVVASTDHFDGGDVAFPANTPGIIAVGGCDRKLELLSNTCIGGKGNHLTVVAPAEDIMTTRHEDDDYTKKFGGCSAAAPHVAGLIALIQQRFPGITSMQVIGRILASAQKTNTEGVMLIDCEAALSLA